MKLIRPTEITSSVLVSSNVPESEAVWSSGTTYAAGAQVRIDTVLYESLQAGNLNKAPATETAWWLRVGSINRWRMFDGGVSSQTTNPDSIEVEVEAPAGTRIDSVALLNVSGASAQVTMTDSVDGVVFDETYSLVSTFGVIDWYSYFFEPIERLNDLLVSDMPPYAGATIEVAIADAGGTAACGEMVIGLSREIGMTLSGASVGIQDYSRKEVDAFGNFSVTERAFSKRANFPIRVDKGLTDQVQNLLARYRATPLVYSGSTEFGSTLIYGFYRDFTLSIDYPDYSICNLELEGLT